MAFFVGRKFVWVKAVILLVLTFAAAAYVAPQYWNHTVARGPFAWAQIFERPFRLGLDLKGGTHLVYQADTSKIPDREQRTSMDGVRDVIERRVNGLGVAEPLVQITRVEGNWRLIVELAGVYDTQKAIDAIGATPVLEFKEQGEVKPPTLTKAQEQQLKVDNEVAKRRAADVLAQALKPDADFAALARQYSEDLGSKEKSGDLGWFKRDVMVKEFADAVFGATKSGTIPRLIKTQFGWHIINRVDIRDAAAPAISAIGSDGNPVNVQVQTSNPATGQIEKEVLASHILIREKTAADILGPSSPWTYTGLDGKHLKRAALEFDPTSNEAEVALEFDSEGAKIFEEVTKRNVQKPIAIFIDGKSPMDTNEDGVITDTDLYAPVVQDVITGGKARITGNLNVDTAKQLARRLQAGALPVPVTLLAQTTVGATLGEESVTTSFQVAQYVFLLVAIFMMLYYRLPGFIATLALIAYIVYVMAVMKFAGATLTLAGLAGLIMSIGMAVDANVLVFERLREELRNGRSILDALHTAFDRAWLAIRDSQATTLITCLILASFSSSVVKGFAITLAIGTVVNIFTALTFTRIFLVLVGGWAKGVPWYDVRARKPESQKA